MAKTETAILAGGCFWGVQDLLRRYPGVLETRVGYSGGDVPNATYRNHGTHAEAIEIVFDPDVISYRQLLEFFFQIHDPSTLNRQGNDRGLSYRSAIFYTRTTRRSRRRAGHDRRRRRLRHVARQGGDRGDRRRPLLGSRARAPGLSGAAAGRLYLPLHPPELDPACSRRSHGRLGQAEDSNLENAGKRLPGVFRWRHPPETRRLPLPLNRVPLKLLVNVTKVR
jgi:methionine-S-sulfoxide reductase